jgi:hypothetical protein
VGEPVQENPIFPTNIAEGPNKTFMVDLDRMLRGLFQEYGHALNDDLLVIPDWSQVITATSYTMLPTDHNIMVYNLANYVWIILPWMAEAEPRPYRIKRITGGVLQCLVWAQAGELIDGSVIKPLNAQYTLLSVITDGNQWRVVHHGLP